MSIYVELDSMPDHKIQLAFQVKQEHIAKVKLLNIASPNKYTDIEIYPGSKNQVIVSDDVKITFNIDIESRKKARSVVNNAWTKENLYNQQKVYL